MKENFGIALRLELITQCSEFGPELLLVVDFPVIGEPGDAVVRRHRLCGHVGQVDYREPTMAQRHPGRRTARPAPVALAVGATMSHGFQPIHNCFRSNRVVGRDDAKYAAHLQEAVPKKVD